MKRTQKAAVLGSAQSRESRQQAPAPAAASIQVLCHRPAAPGCILFHEVGLI